MLRSSALAAVLLALLAPVATAAPMHVGLDISVDDSHITETACPDGVTTIVEKTERWRASGSGT